jgi:hypothetical protein
VKDDKLNLKVGALVKASDGPYGYVERVIINPDDGRVAALAVDPPILSCYPAAVVLLQYIDQVTEGAVQLNLTRAEVAALSTSGDGAQRALIDQVTTVLATEVPEVTR